MARQIRQFEIAALAHLGDAATVIALGFRSRLARGASIEKGAYALLPEPDQHDLVRALRCVPSPGYSVGGFDIEWPDPAKAEPNPRARKGKLKALKGGR
jgi:hypothetical protein